MRFLCTMGKIEIKEVLIKFMEKGKKHSWEINPFVQNENYLCNNI